MKTNRLLDYYTGKNSTLYCFGTGNYHRVRFIRGVPYVTVNRNTRVLYQGISPDSGRIHLNGQTVLLFEMSNAL